MTKKTVKDSRKTGKSQRQAFIDAARKANCDESETAWDGKLCRIAKAKPKAQKVKRGK